MTQVTAWNDLSTEGLCRLHSAPFCLSLAFLKPQNTGGCMGCIALAWFSSSSKIRRFILRCTFLRIQSQCSHSALLRAISCSVLNIVADTVNVPSLVPFVVIQSFGSPTLLCILASRLFFNLREAAERGVNVGTNWSSYSHSAIWFDEQQNGEGQGQ